MPSLMRASSAYGTTRQTSYRIQRPFRCAARRALPAEAVGQGKCCRFKGRRCGGGGPPSSQECLMILAPVTSRPSFMTGTMPCPARPTLSRPYRIHQLLSRIGATAGTTLADRIMRRSSGARGPAAQQS